MLTGLLIVLCFARVPLRGFYAPYLDYEVIFVIVSWLAFGVMIVTLKIKNKYVAVVHILLEIVYETLFAYFAVLKATNYGFLFF